MKAVIALGANIGEPQENLDLAIALLREATDVQSVSSYYTTAPVGGPEQPDFTNAVCIIDSELPAMDLLSLLHGIEKSLGRERVEHWGPRTIDLDLIVVGDEVVVSDVLVLPHPRAHERKFVLEPWLEIDPTAQIPGIGLVESILQRI
jgi:2-amino-4-hydroxy-6-hydroxymethyldihydropteridine diphosphokinase